ncbi:MAG: flagellar hook-associated protein FlgL [Bacillota bacterium]
MRITNRMIAQTVSNNINKNKEMLSKVQEQMSSGKVVSKPSDDPVVAGRVLSLQSVLNEQDQHDKNMEDAIGWIDSSEAALGNVTDTLNRVRELVVNGNNGTLSASDKEAIAYEIEQRSDELIQNGNTNFGGRYIFGGYRTDAPPFEADGQYKGDTGKLNWEVAPRVVMQVNVTGDKVITDVLDVTKNVVAALRGNNKLDEQLSKLDQVMDKLLSERAVLGAKSNRLQAAIQRASDAKVNLTGVMSKLQDIDLAKTVMDYKMQESVYQAALNTGAKLIQPTLLDFLR